MGKKKTHKSPQTREPKPQDCNHLEILRGAEDHTEGVSELVWAGWATPINPVTGALGRRGERIECVSETCL